MNVFREAGQEGTLFNLQSERRYHRSPQSSIPAPNTSFLYSYSVGSFGEDLKISAIPRVSIYLGTLQKQTPQSSFTIDSQLMERVSSLHLPNNVIKKEIKQ